MTSRASKKANLPNINSNSSSSQKHMRRSLKSISNQKAMWSIYKDLQKQIETTWKQLQKEIQSNAPEQHLIEIRNHLLLLLGECNYMAGECLRLQKLANKAA